MRPDPSTDSNQHLPRWITRLEPLLLLCLAFHGVILLKFDGRQPEWIIVGIVGALAVWALIQSASRAPASRTPTGAIRAASAMLAAWALSTTTGGTASLFTLWLFPIGGLYTFILLPAHALFLPFVTTGLYLSLGFLPDSWLPWEITLAQGILIAILSGGAVAIRFYRLEQRQASPREPVLSPPANQQAALDRLARGVAHDFNNLFTAIAGQIALAREGTTADSPAQNYLENAKEALDQALYLNRRLQISAGRFSLNVRLIALNKVVENVAAQQQRQLPPHVALQLELAQDLPQLQAEPEALALLLQEMFAYRTATWTTDKMTLVIKTGQQTISATGVTHGQFFVKTPDPGDYVQLIFADNGHRLADEQISHLFEPYYEPYSPAVGLGPGLISGIVRAHHGSILVESDAAGNTFTIFLPLRHVPPSLLKPSSERITDMQQPRLRLILLVSSDTSLRDNLENQLQGLAVRVMIATDAARGVALYEEFTTAIALVVIEETLLASPEPELLTRVAQRDSALPVIIIGQVPKGGHELALSATILERSVQPADLAATVRGLLQG